MRMLGIVVVCSGCVLNNPWLAIWGILLMLLA